MTAPFSQPLPSSVNRRDFIKGSLVAGAGLALAPWLAIRGAEAAPTEPRPNFVFIFAEDITPDFGCYGDKLAVTPAIDQLAQRGIVYQHCNCVSPVCSPSRSGLGSCMYPTTYGGQNHRGGGKPGENSIYFTRYLRQAGYWVGYFGKTDANKVDLTDAFDVETRNELDKAKWTNPQRGGKPFFMFYNVFRTHEARTWRAMRQYSADYLPADRKQPTPAEIALPPYLADTPGTRQEWVNYYSNITGLDEIVAQTVADLERDGLADNTIIIVSSDHGNGLPRAKRTPYTSGVRVPLIVHVPLKHRWPGIPKDGSTSQQLVSLVDLGPTVLALAGVLVPDYMHGRPFLSATPDNGAKRSFLFAAVDHSGSLHEHRRTLFDGRYRYVRNFLPSLPRTLISDYDLQGAGFRDLVAGYRQRTLSPAGEALFDIPRLMEELYDTKADPHEIVNLADEPAHEPALLRMRQALKDLVMGRSDQTRGKPDLGLFAPGDTAEQMEKVWGWMAWANTAFYGSGPPAPDAERPDLNSKDLRQQYWAAQGLAYAPLLSDADAHILERIIQPRHEDRQADLLLVQVFAAWALARHGRGDVSAALDRLLDMLSRVWAGTKGAVVQAGVLLGHLAPLAADRLKAMESLLAAKRGGAEDGIEAAIAGNARWTEASPPKITHKGVLEYTNQIPMTSAAESLAVLHQRLAGLAWSEDQRIVDGNADGLRYRGDAENMPRALMQGGDAATGPRTEVLVLSHATERGHLYRLQCRNKQDQWVNFGPPVRGTGKTMHRLAPQGQVLRLMQQTPATVTQGDPSRRQDKEPE